MELKQRFNAFVELGKKIDLLIQKKDEKLLQVVRQSFYNNGWFHENQVIYMLQQIRAGLMTEQLEKWLSNYKFKESSPKKVGIIMAGNIPLVGFHDFLCVLISGHSAIIKLSSDDKILLPFLSELLFEMEPEFKHKINFAERLNGIDAVIATGSDNSAPYFEYYFGKYPHIIRKNRNSVAIIKGDETEDDFVKLGEDIFRYYGLGCRNVSKLYLPDGYSLDIFFKAIYAYKDVIENKKYGNNYDYHRAVLMMKQIPFLENGFLILREDTSLASPVSIINYEYFTNLNGLEEILEREKNNIQCVVSKDAFWKNSIPFGTTQCPELNDYADSIDTIDFLLTLTPKN